MAKFLLLVFILLAVIGWGDSAVHFTYEGAEGPDHWAELSPDYAECAGKRQSPIDILTEGVHIVNEKGFLRMYSAYPIPNATSEKFNNNGHTVMLSLSERNLFVSGSSFRTLANTLQCHFHTPSEHTVNGQSFPLELHIVNGDVFRGSASRFQIVVFGILFEEGETEDPLLAALVPYLPSLTTVNSAVNVTLTPHIDLGNVFYEYEGSLTTPPCYETVHWVVSAQIRTATRAQIQLFETTMGENNRPVQGLNGRTVTKRTMDNPLHTPCSEANQECPTGLGLNTAGVCSADLCPDFVQDCCGTPVDCVATFHPTRCSRRCGRGRKWTVYHIEKAGRFGGTPCAHYNGYRKTVYCNTQPC